MKKSFTLIELFLVIILITSLYAIFLPNMKTYNFKKDKILLNNIKSYLKKNFEFSNSLKLSCLEIICYVYVDDEKIKDLEIKGLFTQIPNVFQNDEYVEFNDVKIDNFFKNVIFEIEFNKDYKSKNLLLEFEEKVYYYNPIYEEAMIFESFLDYQNYKEELKIEVNDAF